MTKETVVRREARPANEQRPEDGMTAADGGEIVQGPGEAHDEQTTSEDVSVAPKRRSRRKRSES